MHREAASLDGGIGRKLLVRYGAVRRLLCQTIRDMALMIDRDLASRETSPTGGVVDSQTVKTPVAPARGYDGAKKIVGRKRHIVVGMDGRLLIVNLTTTDIRTVPVPSRSWKGWGLGSSGT